MNRCTWALEEPNKSYHDNDWGIPKYDDTELFEFLVLEGAQAGLSWTTILKRREYYKEVFLHYDVEKLAKLTDKELDFILQDERIIRNRLKVYSVRKNAIAYLKIQEELGSFSNYIWSFTNNEVIVHYPVNDEDLLAINELSIKISKDLKKRGFTFVGETIIYSYLQACGIIDDHLISCDFKKNK